MVGDYSRTNAESLVGSGRADRTRVVDKIKTSIQTMTNGQ